MKTGRKWFLIGIAAAFCLWATPATVAQSDKATPTKPPRDYPVKPVPFTAVHFNDVFWAPRINSGIADVAALTGDTAYLNAIDKIWESMVGRKLYITGGIGATGVRVERAESGAQCARA